VLKSSPKKEALAANTEKPFSQSKKSLKSKKKKILKNNNNNIKLYVMAHKKGVGPRMVENQNQNV
jgi:hypothetical protein